jgi:hypothetical protein
LYALREVVRDELFDTLGRSSATETLFVGCTAYELSNKSLYDNPAYHFSLHGSEAKDMPRTVPAGLSKLVSKLKAKLNKADRAYLAQAIAQKPSSAVVRLKNVQQLISALHSGDFSSVPRVGFSILPKVSRLVAFDSSYNFSPTDYLSLFSDTGAFEMYCVAILPYELHFQDMPQNELYSYREFDRLGVTYSALSFRNGYSDGYVHEKARWATLIRDKVIQSHLFSFSLNVEFVSRAGPMTLVRLSRTTSRAPIYRVIELPEHLKFVRVLDLVASHKACKNFQKLQYISVRETYWWSTVKYLLGLDPKSVNATNAISYVRRCMAGVSMAGTTYQEKWFMDDSHVLALAVSAVVFTEAAHGAVADAQANFKANANKYNWSLFLEKLAWSTAMVMTLGLIVPVAHFVAWLLEKGLVEKIVCTPSMEKVDFEVPTVKVFSDPEVPILVNVEELAAFNPDEEFAPKKDDLGRYTFLGSDPLCGVCGTLRGKLGSQLISCGHNAASIVEWTMSDEELAIYKNELITQATAPDTPENLAKTLREAYESVPTSRITWRGRLENFKAGPGCGKSFVARMLYKDGTMIYAPFGKLRSDYMSQKKDLMVRLSTCFSRRRIRVSRVVGLNTSLLTSGLPWTGVLSLSLCTTTGRKLCHSSAIACRRAYRPQKGFSSAPSSETRRCPLTS